MSVEVNFRRVYKKGYSIHYHLQVNPSRKLWGVKYTSCFYVRGGVFEK